MRTHRPNTARPSQGDPRQRTHRSPVTVDDLLAQLLWPTLLRSYRLAAAPGRLVMCLGFVVALALLDRVYAGIAKDSLPGGPLALLGRGLGTELVQFLRSLAATDTISNALAARALYDLFLGVPLDTLRSHWPVMVVFLPLAVAGYAITGGAVSRSVAYEVSLRATLPWRAAHRFAWSRAAGLIAVVAVPVAGVWLIGALTALVGRLLFDWRFTALLGGAFYFVFLAIAAALVLVMLLYVLAAPMLVPALAVEGSDSFDAANRSFAYVLAKPGRYAAYAIISLVVALIALGVGTTFVLATNQLAQALTNAPIPGASFAPLADATDAPRQFGPTRFFLSVWTAVPWLLLASYALSLTFTAGTLLFLLMRQAVDGQDLAELWVPDEPGPPSSSPSPTHPAAPSPEQLAAAQAPTDPTSQGPA